MQTHIHVVFCTPVNPQTLERYTMFFGGYSCVTCQICGAPGYMLTRDKWSYLKRGWIIAHADRQFCLFVLNERSRLQASVADTKPEQKIPA